MSKLNLGELRKELGLSQRSVGSLLGIQQTRISALERGKYNPKTLTYRRYQDLLVGEAQRREPLKSFIVTVDALPMTRQQASIAIGKPEGHISNVCNCYTPLSPEVDRAVRRLANGEDPVADALVQAAADPAKWKPVQPAPKVVPVFNPQAEVKAAAPVITPPVAQDSPPEPASQPIAPPRSLRAAARLLALCGAGPVAEIPPIRRRNLPASRSPIRVLQARRHGGRHGLPC